jgi:AraC-like DNA-binding protein
MKRIFSTDDVHARDRFDYWHSIACQEIMPHEARARSRSKLEGEIESGAIGDLKLIQHTNSPMSVKYGRRHIAAVTSPDLLFCCQLAGELHLEQEGRQALLRKGDIALVDPLLPFVSMQVEGSKLFIVTLPRQQFEVQVAGTRDLLGLTFAPDQGANRLTSNYARTLAKYGDNLNLTEQHLVQSHFMELATLSLSQYQSRPSSSRMLAVLKIRKAIENSLADPRLRPSSAASLAGLSVRYANRLLAEQGTSLGRLILSLRLERCRKTIADSSCAHRSLSEIAFSWGFSDMTHFGRTFRQCYGISPSEYRALIGAPKEDRH